MLGSPGQWVSQQFDNLGADIRLVVLHPNYVQQHGALDGLLRDSHAIYVRFNGLGLTAAQLDDQVALALEHQAERAALRDVRLLVLDECDRTLPDEFDQFLMRLVMERTTGRVVVLTRVVPQVALSDDGLRNCSSFLPNHQSLMLWDYAKQDGADKALLEVRALGAGRVLLNGKAVDSWDGLLPRSLFFYLVDKGMTTRGDIFETFWPTLSTREATNVFHVTKRKISEVLGIDLTVYWSGFYHIAPTIQLSYDAALFSEAVQDSAVVEQDEAVALLRQAALLYRGDFLTSIDMPWTQKRRQELLQTYGETLVGLAKGMERRGDTKEALGYYLQAATTNRQREDLAHSIMRLYRDLGMRADAVIIYRRLEEELKQALGVTPAPHVQELAASIHAELDGHVH